jgi:hypothetical protein
MLAAVTLSKEFEHLQIRFRTLTTGEHMNTGIIPMLAVSGLLALTACDFERSITAGPMVSDPVSIDGGKADRANIELNIGAGKLTLRGGAGKLLEGTLDYNVPSWKPQITSSLNGDHSTVTIRQPDSGGSSLGGKLRNDWDLQVADKTLLDLTVNCGAGEAHLNLRNVLLRDLHVQMGAGQLDLDLTGTPQRDYEVDIQGGVGQAKVHLPEGVGIWASAQGGIGSIQVTGLTKHGDHWENDLYDKAKVNVRIKVEGGIGDIHLIG